MFKSKYLVPGLALLAIATIVLGGIFLVDKKEVEIPKDDGKIVIGFCMDNMVIERWQRDKEIFIAKANELGYEVLFLNANSNNKRQNEQIRSLIELKVDVIVVNPYQQDGVSESVLAAKKAGIKVIAYDRLILNANVDAYLSFDNLKVGKVVATSLMDLVPKGKYVIINGSPKDHNSKLYNDGYMGELAPFIQSGEITIVKEVWADDWSEEVSYNTVNELLNNGEEINAIIGANDRLAEGAIKALTEHGLAGKVQVAGHDADVSACQRIVEGTQAITVYKPIPALAEGAVDIVNKMINNEFIQVDERINDGQFDVPYIKFDVIAITKNNLDDTVIQDGFHSREDIYR